MTTTTWYGVMVVTQSWGGWGREAILLLFLDMCGEHEGSSDVTVSVLVLLFRLSGVACFLVLFAIFLWGVSILFLWTNTLTV